MKRLLVYLVLMGVGIGQAEVPKLFTEKNFTSTTLAEAVNHFVAIGQDAAVKEMQELAAQKDANSDCFLGKGFSTDERIGWVCRILFQANDGSSLRPPKYGYLSLPEKFMPADQWPLYPVVQSGSTYIVLCENYTAKGVPETAAHYIKYCVKNGAFRKIPVAVPTKEQALKDTLAFRQSDLWKKMKWEDADGISYLLGEQFTWAFLESQAKMISDPIPANSATMIARQKPKSNPATAVAKTSPAAVKPAAVVASSSPVPITESAEAESSSTAAAKPSGISSSGIPSSPGGMVQVNSSVLSFR
jgi:hypothetical protein